MLCFQRSFVPRLLPHDGKFRYKVTSFCSNTSVPAWLRGFNGSVVELLHAIDVGNSDWKTAVDICKVSQKAYGSIMKLSFIVTIVAKTELQKY